MTHKFEPRVPDAQPGQDGWGVRAESAAAPAAAGLVCSVCGGLEDEHEAPLLKKLRKK